MQALRIGGVEVVYRPEHLDCRDPVTKSMEFGESKMTSDVEVNEIRFVLMEGCEGCCDLLKRLRCLDRILCYIDEVEEGTDGANKAGGACATREGQVNDYAQENVTYVLVFGTRHS